MNRIIGNMFIKVVKEVSLLSYIKEHFNIWETDFQDINYIYIYMYIYVYIWRPLRTPACLTRQVRRVHQKIIQFNYLILGWRTAAVKNAYFFGMPYISSKLRTVTTMSVSVIAKIFQTFQKCQSHLAPVLRSSVCRGLELCLDGCVCVALGTVGASKWVYPYFKASCYIAIRC